MRLPLLIIARIALLDRAIALSTRAALHFHHRFLPFPSSASIPEWQHLGSAAVDADMTATRLEATKGGNARTYTEPTSVDGKGWYQVGVERDGDWVFASTRACLLATAAPGIVLHMTDSHLTSISLQTTKSRCSNTTAQATIYQLPATDAVWDIQIQRPIRIHSPSASTPAPAADPNTGLPIQPPPEKSFIQKWWMVGLGLALFLLGQLGTSDAPAAAAK